MLAIVRQLRARALAIGLMICGALLAQWPCRAGPLLWQATTIPAGGSLVAAPGDTVGWGYTISNHSTNWLLPSSLDADPFSYGTTLAIFDFPLLAPGQTITMAFVPDVQGLFQFTWDIDAPTGAINAGLFTLTVDFYSGNPFLGGSLVMTDFAELPYSATLPEPDALLLVGSTLALAALASRRRRSARASALSQRNAHRSPAANMRSSPMTRSVP